MGKEKYKDFVLQEEEEEEKLKVKTAKKLKPPEDKEIGFNYFTIVKAVKLVNGYQRITIKNDYVRTNDINIILYCFDDLAIGNRIEIKALTT